MLKLIRKQLAYHDLGVNCMSKNEERKENGKNNIKKEMHKPIYKLCIRAENEPTVVTEGKEATIKFFAKNIGDSSFPGGKIWIYFYFSSLGQQPFWREPIEISTPIEPNSELHFGSIKNTAIAAGYALFQVVGASAIDQEQIQCTTYDGHSVFPMDETGSGHIFHAVRIQTRGEISQRKALWISAGSLVTVVIFQAVGLILRFLYGF